MRLIVKSQEARDTFDAKDCGSWPWPLKKDQVASIIDGDGPPPLSLNSNDYPHSANGRRCNPDACKIAHTLNGELVIPEWLAYSESKNHLKCIACSAFYTGTKASRFEKDGYCDWKHLKRDLKYHSESDHHYQSMLEWIKYTDIEGASNPKTSKKRERMLRIVETVLFLGMNNIAFRGSGSEDWSAFDCGKFKKSYAFLAKFDHVAKEHIDAILEKQKNYNKRTQVTYLSPSSQNQWIKVIEDAMTDIIVQEIKAAKWFSILLDETPDTSNQEQLTVIIRYVKFGDEVTIEERFLRFLNIEGTTSGEAIFKLVKAFLVEKGIDIMDCRGQGYDNGANMSGKYKGVQARFKDVNSLMFFIPCCNHTLNLAINETASSTLLSKLFFATLQSLYTFFTGSPQRQTILMKFCSVVVKALCETRWSARINSIKAVIDQVPEILASLEEVQKTSSDGDVIARATGLINEVGSYKFLLQLDIWYSILSITNTATEALQSIDMNLDAAVTVVNDIVNDLASLRDGDGFTLAKERVADICDKIQVEPTFPNSRARGRASFFISASARVNRSTEYVIGERVEALFESDGISCRWYVASVKRLNDNGSLHIVFDDGYESEETLSQYVRKFIPFQVGDPILGKFGSSWYPAKIHAAADDNSVEIEYYDEKKRVVDLSFVSRLLTFKEGDRIESIAEANGPDEEHEPNRKTGIIIKVNAGKQVLKYGRGRASTVKEIDCIESYDVHYDGETDVTMTVPIDKLLPPTPPPLRQPEAASDTRAASAELEFIADFFVETINTAIESIKERFSQLKVFEESFGFLTKFLNCLPGARDEAPNVDLSQRAENAFYNLYGCSLEKKCRALEKRLTRETWEDTISDLDGSRLYTDLKRVYSLLHSPHLETNESPYSVMAKDSAEGLPMLSILNYLHQRKSLSLFPDAVVAIRILLTLPMSVASAERSFSKLKLLKNYLRSTMGQDRLCGLALMFIEPELAESLDRDELIDRFWTMRSRRGTLLPSASGSFFRK